MTTKMALRQWFLAAGAASVAGPLGCGDAATGTSGDTNSSTGSTASTGDPPSTSTSDLPTTSWVTTMDSAATDTTATTGPVDTTDITASSDTDSQRCTPGQVEACYSGPAGTEDVGECSAGAATCGDDGAWGPCVGEVVPARETCDAPGDEDCDGVDPCVGDGSHVWSKTWGARGEESGVRLGFDAADNLVVAAWGTSTSDFGGGPLASAGAEDLYLAKFAPDGTHLWSKNFGDEQPQFSDGWALAVAPGGDIVVSGHFKGSIDFGGGPLPNASDQNGFLVRLTGDGDHVWSKPIVGSFNVRPMDLALDGDSDIHVVGFFAESIDFGGGDLVSAGGDDGFIAKFSAAGEHAWSRRFGGAEADAALAVDIDASGNAVLGGSFRGTIDLGLGPLPSAGESDILIAKFDPLGDAIWAERYGGAQSQSVDKLVVDSEGKITFTGRTVGSVDFGGGSIPALLPRGLVVQLDSVGGHVWSKQIADCPLTPVGLAVDGFDNLLLAGHFEGFCDFGGGSLTSAGGWDIFALKLSPGGNHVWSKGFGDSSFHQGARAAASSPTGKNAVCGGFRGAIDFGGGPAENQSSENGFVAVFNP